MKGMATVALGLISGLIGNLSNIPDIITYGFIMCIVGLVLITMGTKRGLKYWAPLFYLIFMLPLPNFLYWPLSIKLQMISSEIGVAFIQLFNVPVFLGGNVIDLGEYEGTITLGMGDGGTFDNSGAYDISVYQAAIPPPPVFLRGDSNTDLEIDISDAVHTLIHLFLRPVLRCEKAADYNDDGKLSITDAIATLIYLFRPWPWPPPEPPWGEIGPDPTPDDLTCNEYPVVMEEDGQ